MQTHFRVLSENEKATIHEQTLSILSKTGVRVGSEKGRRLLKEAGAGVHKNNDIVRFPANFVEASIQMAPKKFSLGARRPGWDLSMNKGECTLLLSGEGTHAIDRQSGEIRNSTFQDWVLSTQLSDFLDEIGMYWKLVETTDRGDEAVDYIDYLIHLFRNFSKHVQDSTNSVAKSQWLLEVLQVVFGSKEAIKRKKPFSFVLCPQSPLMIDETYTDAYLELGGWGIPVAIMPMPLMGATAPASLISTIIIANCEILATNCLVQASEPNTPVIYAAVSSLMDPRTGLVKSGCVEEGLISAASNEMARYYGLPSETSGLETGRFELNFQSSYETALSALLSMLSFPDIMVGAGVIGGGMVLSLEQLLIDTEIFKMCRRAHQGIASGKDQWLFDLLEQIEPGAQFIDHPTTLKAVRSDELHISRLEAFEGLEAWRHSDKTDIVVMARTKVDQILSSYQALPLGDEVEQELQKIKNKAI
jgi:trimethylamine--corrinoid protein Co-methyltransferase